MESGLTVSPSGEERRVLVVDDDPDFAGSIDDILKPHGYRSAVAFGARDSGFSGVFRSLYIDAIGGAGGGAQETGYTFLQAVFVALQHVHAAKAFLELCAFQRAVAVGIVLDDGGLKHLLQGDSHSLGYGADVFDHGHARSL